MSFRDYGEFESQTGAPTPQNPDGTWAPNDPSIGAHYCPDCAGWNLNISDLDRYNAWRAEFDGYVRSGSLPALEIMRLPNDHTAGTKPGALTPQAYVAQNDLAVGKVVDAVSHSPYWKDTAIFITEDDAQDGPDHVDAHRTEALVVSPYTERGAVDSTYYDTASMVRTMEDILGLPPMTQYDAAAVPMWGGFADRADLAPYTAVAHETDLTATNTAASPMAALSATFDFSQEDKAPMQLLNRAVWAATKGGAPYPAQPAAAGTQGNDD